MRNIDYQTIVDAVAELCFEAAMELPGDVLTAIRQAEGAETSELGKSLLKEYVENAAIARDEAMPLCQDTGFAVFFVELGDQVRITGGDLSSAINEGTAKGYQEHYLRKSIVRDPIFDRTNTGDNTPAVIHLDLVPGDKLEILLAPKGGGSENMSAIAMLKPSQGRDGVVQFVADTVIGAGGNPCPPTIVGVGVGGTFEKAAFLAKKALLRPVGAPHPDPNYAKLEAEILEKINASGVGSQGLGGDVTAFAVHVEPHPCHIASLPVAVNLNCHAARHAATTL